jgi:hypothetical protein
MDSMFIVVATVRPNLGHQGYLGYLVYLGSLCYVYHGTMFTFVTTATLLVSGSMVAYVTMVIMFAFADKCYVRQPAGWGGTSLLVKLGGEVSLGLDQFWLC